MGVQKSEHLALFLAQALVQLRLSGSAQRKQCRQIAHIRRALAQGGGQSRGDHFADGIVIIARGKFEQLPQRPGKKRLFIQHFQHVLERYARLRLARTGTHANQRTAPERHAHARAARRHRRALIGKQTGQGAWHGHLNNMARIF